MTSDVDPVALVANGSRNPAHVFASFKNNGFHIRSLQKFIGGGKPGRPGSDDNGNSLAHMFQSIVNWIPQGPLIQTWNELLNFDKA